MSNDWKAKVRLTAMALEAAVRNDDMMAVQTLARQAEYQANQAKREEVAYKQVTSFLLSGHCLGSN